MMTAEDLNRQPSRKNKNSEEYEIMIQNEVPNYPDLIEATFEALHALGGSGKNDEINNYVIILYPKDIKKRQNPS